MSIIYNIIDTFSVIKLVMEWYFGAKQAINECLPLSKVVALRIGHHNSIHNELWCASDGA